MYLARDVLDKEILDRDGFKGGKVDDLLLEMRAGDLPVVRALVTQHGALARLLPGPLMRLGRWLHQTVLDLDSAIAPVEIAWRHVTRIDVTVHIDLARVDAGLMRSERAVWERVISRLPLARR